MENKHYQAKLRAFIYDDRSIERTCLEVANYLDYLESQVARSAEYHDGYADGYQDGYAQCEVDVT